MTDYSELVKRLKDDSRYSQSSCPKCEKGFENQEYHCWGPETKGCLASWESLRTTVRLWKKDRADAAAAILALTARVKELEEENARLRSNTLDVKRSDLQPTSQTMLHTEADRAHLALSGKGV